MTDDSHKEFDFDFVIDGTVFTKLFYLVDGIYPCLTRFLPTIADLSINIDCNFATDQETMRKDVKKGFGVLKRKFLGLSSGISLHHWDDIYYLVFVCILIHNMMVEARIKDDEREDCSMYNNDGVDGEEIDHDDNENDEYGIIGFSCNNRSLDNRMLKYELVQKQWEAQYDFDGVVALQTAMKCHLYKQKFGKDCMMVAYEISPEYDSLRF